MQSKRRSWFESIATTMIAVCYAIPLNYVMVAKIHWDNYWNYAVINTLVFVTVSIVFKYILRRFFNWLDVAKPDKPLTREYPNYVVQSRNAYSDYLCPVCHEVGGAYLTCNRPYCPDGR